MADLETLEISEGNTNIPPKSKQCTQLMHWCFTWNNYVPADIETLETLFKFICHKYCFQEETGENGTKHLQGVISLKKKMRWTEFGLPKQIHWEKCKCLTAAYKYCSKDDTRTGNVYTLNYKLPFKQSLSKLFDWEEEIIKLMNSEPDDRNIY